jgi:uncharacterized protein (DUF302 family)
MDYYFSTRLKTDFNGAVEKITQALKEQGFGVLTDIDVQRTFKEKLGIDYKKYRILGACSPPYAHRALEAEDKIGTMLPCNVIVQELGSGEIEVAAINPIASMQAVNNSELIDLATEVTQKLKSAIETLKG